MPASSPGLLQREDAEHGVGETAARRPGGESTGDVAQAIGAGIEADDEERRIASRRPWHVDAVARAEVEVDRAAAASEFTDSSVTGPVFALAEDAVHGASYCRRRPPLPRREIDVDGSHSGRVQEGMLPRLVRPLCLLLALVSPACGDDKDGTGSATEATSVTSATTATTPGSTGDATTVNPTTGASTDGGSEATGSSDGTGASATESSAGSDTDGVKLDLAMPDFGDSGGESMGCTYIDVLFIVDISASMSEEKQNLNDNFPQFVTVLDGYVDDPQNPASSYRLGVTNSSIVDNKEGMSTMGLDGALFDGDNIFGPDCDLMGNLWIDGPGPTVTSTFSCLAPNPKSSCNNCTDLGKERPLDTIEMFIDKSAPGGVNDGFYRGDESLLVIVMLTDEDDDVNNTTTTPAQTKLKLDEYTGGEDRYVVVTIAGPQNMDCNSAFGEAAPAPTLHAFTGMVKNGLMGDICQGDLAQSLADALALITESCDTLPPPVG